MTKDDSQPIVMSEEILSQFSQEEQILLRPTRSVVINMEAVIKFHQNQQENQLKKNPFVSWTLNKIAVIDKNWLQQFIGKDLPIKDGEFWRVKIEHETSPGQPIGCFVVRPLWKVNREELAILAPSTWTVVQHGLTVILYPKIRPWLPWIIPKALRQMIMRKTGGAALIIPLAYPPDKKLGNMNEELPTAALEELNTVIADSEVTYAKEDDTF